MSDSGIVTVEFMHWDRALDNLDSYIRRGSATKSDLMNLKLWLRHGQDMGTALVEGWAEKAGIVGEDDNERVDVQ